MLPLRICLKFELQSRSHVVVDDIVTFKTFGPMNQNVLKRNLSWTKLTNIRKNLAAAKNSFKITPYTNSLTQFIDQFVRNQLGTKASEMTSPPAFQYTAFISPPKLSLESQEFLSLQQETNWTPKLSGIKSPLIHTLVQRRSWINENYVYQEPPDEDATIYRSEEEGVPSSRNWLEYSIRKQ